MGYILGTHTHGMSHTWSGIHEMGNTGWDTHRGYKYEMRYTGWDTHRGYKYEMRYTG